MNNCFPLRSSVWTQIHLVLAVLLLFSFGAARAQDVVDMNLDELSRNAMREIETGKYSKFKTIKVEEFKLLAWYREKDNRPWYVDNALCWAKVTTEAGPKWVLVHLARNPMKTANERYRIWHSYLVLDAPNGWFIYFDNPPKNRDVYDSMRWFRFEPEKRWSRYDKFLDRNAWQAAIGEPPAKDL